MKMTLEEISSALKSVGDLNGSEKIMPSSVQTDSRLVKPGDLFICLCGQKMDGHKFAGQAAQKGAAAIVSHHPMSESGVPVLLVEDTLRALGRLARHWRIKKGKMVMAVTGSAGKTTTKEMLSNVLGAGRLVGKNYKNWNNQIGLPLSILRFSGDEEFWVLELGINNPADMDELADIARPDLAVILNIGPCHLQGLDNIEGVAKSKAKILDHLQNSGKAVICRDYFLLENEVAARPHVYPVWFSCSGNPADYSVKHLASGHFNILEDGQSFTFRSMPGGEQYCENIGAVWAAARHSGMTPARIIPGLENFQFPEQRFSIKQRGSWTVIDDTYNANPLSMKRAIHSAKLLARERDLFLVLGDMKELGRAEVQAHLELGKEISKSGCKSVFFHGKNAGHVRDGLDNGLKSNFYEIRNRDHFESLMNRLGYKGGVLLFKGSRSLGMEKFIACFRESAPTL